MTDQLSSGSTKICPACAEDIKVDATVCRYCGQEFVVRSEGYCGQCHRQVEVDAARRCPTCDSPVIDVIVSSEAAHPVAAAAPLSAASQLPTASAPPSPPVAPPVGPHSPPSAQMSGPTAAPPSRSRGGLVGKLVIGFVAVVVIVIGALFIGTQLKGDARVPTELTDKFSRADVTCTKLDAIYDQIDQRQLGCVSTDAQLITVTTFADRPSTSSWIDGTCRAQNTGSSWKGAVVTGDDFIIVVVQGPYPQNLFTPPTPKTVANRLAGVLGGSVTTFNCDTRSSS